MAGRTVAKHARVYMDGYDISGDTRSIGALMCQFEEADMTCLTDAVKGALPNQATLGIGTLNCVMNNTASSGIHAVLSSAGQQRTVLVTIGSRTDPAQGDPAYCAVLQQKDYLLDPNNAGVYLNISFDKTSSSATSLLYARPWGWLLHAKGAETAANTAVGIDDNGGASAFGGYMMYHVFAGNGTATIKVQDAAVNSNGSFADLSGATTGSIDCTTPKHGIVALGRTATVRQYLRWQMVLGTATTVTFALAFVRATY